MAPEYSSAKLSSEYLAREKRVNDAFALKKPDRVPAESGTRIRAA